MADETEVIREEIDRTRSKLNEDLASLEGQIRETVTSIRTGMRRMTPAYQIQQRPLIAMGGSVLAGAVVGGLAARRKGAHPGTHAEATRASGEAEPAPGRGLHALSAFRREFDDEIRLAKNLAKGALVRGIAKLAKDAFPGYRVHIDDLVERVAGKFDADSTTEEKRSPGRPTLVT